MVSTPDDTRHRESAPARVLVVEDDATVRDVVRRYLERAGHEVAVVGEGAAALAQAYGWRPDLVVLDLMLPDMNGLDVCRVLRDDGDVAVLMLTALGEESDRVLGLEVGADDYVTKPFSPRELVLRVASILRRGDRESAFARADGTEAGQPVQQDGELVLDRSARTAHLRGQELSLTARELALLSFLMANPGRAFTREELLARVWGWSFGDHSTVTVHVKRLRRKVEDDPLNPRRICTVWGVGYRYDPGG
jgi:two-component system, OmpR family, response regulator ResD